MTGDSTTAGANSTSAQSRLSRSPEPMSRLDELFMRAAIEQAVGQGRDPKVTSIGCVIVLDDRIVAAERNSVMESCDPTAHAEITAIRSACAALRNVDLRGATLYSTLQPCGMCTMAALWSKIGRIVYGAERADVHPMYFEARHLDTIAFIRDAYRNDLSLTAGILRRECAALYFAPDATPAPELQGNR
jgi:tRNA(adenine34) deaminase